MTGLINVNTRFNDVIKIRPPVVIQYIYQRRTRVKDWNVKTNLNANEKLRIEFVTNSILA